MKSTGKKTKTEKSPRRTPSHSESGATPGLARWLPPALIVLLTTAAFLPTLQNGFVNWDDEKHLVNNVHYRGLGWTQLRWMFTTFHMGHYQPLSWVTLGLDYLLWGMNPVGYHLTSLLLHAANAVVFYFVTLRLLRLALSRPPGKGDLSLRVAAGFAALVFALHPLRVESVAWATERRDVLSGLFFLLTLLCYLRATTAADTRHTYKRWLVASVLVYALSLLSKATGMTLPIILLVLDVYPLRRLGGGPGRWVGPEARRVWIEKIPFVVLALAGGTLAFVAQREAGALTPLERYGATLRLAQAFYGIAFYLGKTVVPLRLSPLYELPPSLDPFSWPFLSSAVAVLIISTCLLAVRRRWPAGLAVWICYLVILTPVLGIAQSGPQLAADRYSYLSCLGWAVLAGAGLLASHRRTAALLTGLAAGVVVALGVLTWQQVQVWRDSETLWRQAVSADPTSKTAHYNFAALMIDQGRTDAAIPHYRQALQIDPAYAEAHLNLGIALVRQGNLDDAITHYRQALRIRPAYAKAHNNLGVILAKLGKADEAIGHYRQALAADPTHADAHNNLGNVLAKLGRLKEALAHYRQALEIDPGHAKAHNNLGNALARQGQLSEAVTHYRQALEIDPAYAEAHYNLGLALGKLGRLDEALASYRMALDVAPKDWPPRQSVQHKLNETLDKLQKGK